MKKNTIGIIGVGFVGGAVKEVFGQHFPIETYDKDPEKSTTQSLTELAQKAHILFLALPTPVKNGSCYLDIILNTLDQLNQHGKENLIIIKSSVPPGSCKNFQAQFKNLRLVFAPEFLKERSAVEDFLNQKKVILAGSKPDVKVVKKLFNDVLPNAFVHTTDFTTAELVKFTINTYLASKLSYFNELYQLCEKLNVDYDQMLFLTLLDERIEASHTQIPGYDGARGWGGSCFPANIQILIDTAIKLGVDPKVLRAAWEKNLEVRPERDWEELKGRTVV